MILDTWTLAEPNPGKLRVLCGSLRPLRPVIKKDIGMNADLQSFHLVMIHRGSPPCGRIESGNRREGPAPTREGRESNEVVIPAKAGIHGCSNFRDLCGSLRPLRPVIKKHVGMNADLHRLYSLMRSWEPALRASSIWQSPGGPGSYWTGARIK